MKFRRQPKPSRKNDSRKSKTNRPSKLRAKIASFAQRRFRPLMEVLEDRRLLANDVWQGPASLGVWSNPANWTLGVPTANSVVQFNGGISSTDDIVGLIVGQVDFTAGGDTILGAGGGVTLGINGAAAFTNIQSTTGINTFDASLPLVLSGTTMGVVVSAGQVNINGVIGGSQALVLQVGSKLGTLQLGDGSGTDASNTYTGDTFVDEGTLLLDKAGSPAAVAIPHNLFVGGGISNSAVAREVTNNQIADAGNVTLASNGLFDLNGKLDTISTLGINNGSVTTGVGILTATSAINVADSANPATLVVNASSTNAGNASINGAAAFNFAGINSLSFDAHTGAGADSLTINNPAGGVFAPAGGISDTGASLAGDSLFDLGGGSGATDAGVYTPTGAHSGTLKHTEGATVQTITFSGLTPATDTVASGTFAINGTGIASLFGVVDGPVGTTTVTDTTAESMTFANKTVVNINGNNAADTFTVNNPNPATGLSTLNLNGGTTSGDVVNLQATGGTVTTNWFANGSTALPNAAVNVGNAGSVQGIKGTINLEGPLAEYNAVVVDNSADVTGRAVTLSSFVQPGLGEAGQNWGKIHGLSASADINYSFGDTRILTVDGGAGGNTWTVNATAGAQSGGPQRTNTINAGNGGDSFAINASGMGVNPVGGAHFNSDNFFNGGTGNDTFTVSGSLAGDTNTTLHINGNAPSFPTFPGDVLNIPTGSTVSLTGIGSGSVSNGGNTVVTSYTSIEDVASTGTYNLILNMAAAGFQEGNAATDKIVAQTDATGTQFQLLVGNDGTAPTQIFAGTMADINSLSVEGSTDPEQLVINEVNGHLPAFGGTSPDSHTNGAFTGSGPSPANIGINFSGGGGGTHNSIVFNFTTSQNVTEFSDAVAAANSGVVAVAGAFNLSFAGLFPITYNGAGGTLTLSDAANASVSTLTVTDAGGGVTQVAGNGTWETDSLDGFNNLVVQGINANNNTITLVNASPLPTLGNALTAVTLQGGAGNDSITVNGLPATITATLLGGDGTNLFTLDNSPAHNLQSILGPVIVSPAGDSVTALDTLTINDSGDPTGRTVKVTSTTIDGITGAAPTAITYDGSSRIRTVNITGDNFGNTFNIQSTNVSTSTLAGATGYNIFTGNGNDTVNVSSDAPVDTGNLLGIQGPINLDTQGNSSATGDTLNVSDLGNPLNNTYTLAAGGGGSTVLTTNFAAPITYDASLGAGQLEHFNLTGSPNTAALPSTYNIDLTSATVSNTVNDGEIGDVSGFSTFNIDANNLQSGASNTFNSFGGGSDTFNMNLNGSFIPTAAGTTAVINGLTSAAHDDVVNVNTQTAAANFVGINYGNGVGDHAFVTGLGTDLAGPGIQVNNTRQINYNGSSANADTLTVTSPTAGAHTISVTPISANSANVFLDGTPLLTGTNSPTNNPGVFGGGAGPDVFLQGVAQNSFQVSAGSATDNKLIVNGPSEGFNGAGASSAWGGNAFGSPSDIQAPGNAFNTIGVTDSQVAIFSTGPGTLLNVNYNNGGFVSTAAPAAATVIVNSGDQAGEQGSGIADDITVTLSTAIRFQVNGGLPGLTMVGGIPQGDQLNVDTVGAVNVFSDGANPPNVSINSAIAGTLPVTYTSIERLNVHPGNGIVNIIGDNNIPGGGQNDYFKVRGGPDLLQNPIPANGVGQFSLQIGGDWNPTTGTKDLSAPIYFFGVTRINASGGAAASFDVQGNAIPDTADPAGVNALDITPYADNLPEGWGIETFYNQGNAHINDGGIDLLTFNGVPGVSDNITVIPSAPQAGQIVDNVGGAPGALPIAIVNYTNNSNIIVNASSPPGTPGDTDTLTLDGTNPNNPTTSGNEDVLANFVAAGDATHPMVRFYDAGASATAGRKPTPAEVVDTTGTAANILYNLQNYSNFNTINFALGGGHDLFNLISGLADGSLGLNVGGGPGVAETIQVNGSEASGDKFRVTPGATSDAGTISTELNLATAATLLNYTGTKNVSIVGLAGGGSDSITLDGTGGNDVFTATNGGVGATTGTAQVNAGPAISYSGLGTGLGTALDLNAVGGSGGSDSFTLTQAAGPIPNVTVNGGATSTVSITGSGGADSFTFAPTSANSATLTDTLPGPTTTYTFAGTTSLSLNGVSLADAATLTVTPTSAIITPGSSTGSGTVTATNASHQALLPLSYTNISAATVSGGTLVVDATDDNDTVTVDAAGNVTVLNRSTLATNTYAAGGYTGLVIDVSGDNGLVNIAPSAFFLAGGIQVFGDSDGSGNTMLTYTGGAGVVNVNIDNHTISEAGDAVVGFNGVGTVNTSSTNALGVNFIGGTGSENLAVTPTGVGSATVVANGAGPLYVVTSAPHLTSTFSGVGNTLVFNGNSAGEAFSATPGLIGVPADMQMFYTPSEFSSVTFNGLGGNNVLTVDSSTGPVTAPIIFNGGTGSGNSLVLSGGVATNDMYAPGPGAGEGTDTLTFVGGTESVHFNNLTPVTDSVISPNLSVFGTNGDDAITYSADPANPATNGLVSVNNLETISFLNKTTLDFEGLSGTDTFSINNKNTPTGMSTTVAIPGIEINVQGNPGSNIADTLVVNGTGTNAIDNIQYLIQSEHSATIIENALPVVDVDDIGNLVVNGNVAGTGAVDLTVNTLAGFDYDRLVPGPTIDSGTVYVTSAVNDPVSAPVLTFSKLGAGGGLSFVDETGTRQDTLEYDGTAGNDTFTVAPGTGAVTLNSQLTVSTPGVSNLVLNGLAGENTYNISATPGNPQPFTSISIAGSGLADPDVVNLTGDGTPVTVNMGTPTPTVTGGGLGVVDISGVGTVNLNDGAGTILVDGTANADSFNVTPTGTNTAEIQANPGAPGPVLNATTTSTLTIDPLGGNNTVTVNGTAANDVIGVVRAATTTVTVNALKTISITSADVSSLTVNSGTTSTAAGDVINVSGSGGTALDIVGGQTPANATLNVTNSATSGGTSVTPGSTVDAGTISNADGVIAFAGIKRVGVTDTAANLLTIRGTNGNDAITAANLGGTNLAWVNGQAPVSFSGFNALALSGGFGNDTYTVSPVGIVFVGPVATQGITVTGTPGAADTVTVNGSAVNDTIGYNPTGAAAGNVTITGSPTVTMANIAGLAINGQGGTDALTVTTPAGGHIVTYTPGAAPDAGTIATRGVGGGTTLVPLTFSKIGANGSVSFASAGGRTDFLELNGTNNSDVFNVNGPTDQIQVLAPGAGSLFVTDVLHTGGIDHVQLRGLNGDDTFNLTGALPYADVLVDGSGAADPAVVNLTGDGSSTAVVTLSVAGSTVTGDGLGIVNIIGVGVVNINGNGAAVTVDDADNGNTLAVSPGATETAVQIVGQSPVVNVATTPTFTADLTGTGDTLLVNGTTPPVGGDTFNVNTVPNTVAIVGLQTVNYIGAVALDLAGGNGSDTFNVTPSAIPIFVDGGNPVGVQPGDQFNLVAGGGPVTFFPGPTSDSGGFQVGANAPVSFTHIETVGTITVTPIPVPGPFLIQGTNGDDDIQVTATGNHSFSFSVNAGPTITVTGDPNLSIDGLAGDDEFQITGPAAGALYNWDETINVAGVSHAAGSGNSNVLSFITPLKGTVLYTPTPAFADAGVLSYTQSVGHTTTINIGNNAGLGLSPGGVQQLTLDGQGQNDPLTLVAGGNTVVATPGATRDSGTLAAGGLLPIGYTNLGLVPTAPITVTGAPALVYNGTPANDTFTVAGTGLTAGQITLNNQLPIVATGGPTLTLNGLAGDNTYTINAGNTYTTINVNGSGLADPDVVNLNGNGASTATAIMGTPTPSVSGAGLGTVDVSGVGTVNLTNGTNTITVDGTATADSFSVTPTTATSAAIQANGVVPVLNAIFTGAGGTLNVDPLGGNNSVTVNGTASTDTITTALGATTKVSVDGLLPVNLTSVDTQSLVLSGGAGSDTYAFTGAGGPGAVTVTGGSGRNTITLPSLAGGDFYQVVPGSDSSSGDTFYGGSPQIAFTGVQNIGITGAGVGASDFLDMEGTGGNDTFNLNGTASGAGTAQVNGGPLVTFNSFGTVGSGILLDGNGGADTFNVSQPANWNIANVLVPGGSPGAGGTLLLSSGGAADGYTYTSTGPQAGTVTLTSGTLTTYSLTNVANLNVNDTLTGNAATLTVTNANAVITPGTTPGTGTVTTTDVANSTALLPLTYTNIFGTVSASGTSVVINAPDVGDVVTVSALGVVSVKNPLGVTNSVDVSGYANLVLDLLGSNDTVTFAADSALFAGGVNIVGGGSGYTVTAPTGAASTLDLSNNSVSGVVGGLVTLSGIGNLVLNGAATALTVNNYGSPSTLATAALNGDATIHVSMAAASNTVDYTPLSPTKATLALAGGGPTLNIAGFNNVPGNLTLTSAAGFNTLDEFGSSGNDAIGLTIAGGATRLTQTTGGVWVPVDFSGVGFKALGINAGTGNDTVTVDSSNGPVTTPITYDGGAGNNSLILSGTPVAGPAVSDTYTPGPGTGQGVDTIVFAGGTESVHFMNLAPVIDTVASATLTVFGTNGNDAIAYTQGPNSGTALVGGATTGEVSVNNLETIEFANKTALAIKTGNGTDTVSVNDATTPTGLTGNIAVNGGDPSAGDTLIVTESATNPLVLEPTAQGAGTVNRFLGGLPPTVFTGMGHLTLVGQLSSNDPFGIDGTAGNDHFEYIPGATPDTGTVVGTMNQNIAAFPLVPTTFTGMSQGGTLLFNNFAQPGGTDSFTFDGTSANENISVAPTLPSGLSFNDVVNGLLFANIIVDNLASAVVQTGTGTDTVNVAGNILVPLSVQADPTTLNFNGTGAPITIDPAAGTVTETGFSPVSFTGVENLNVAAAGGAVTVVDSASNNTLTATPTGAVSSTVSISGVDTLVNISGAAAATPLTVNFTGAGDTLLVDGTTPAVGGETFNVNTVPNSVAIVGLQTVDYTGAVALDVTGGEGSDTFNVTPSAIPIFVDGGNPVAVKPGDVFNLFPSGGGVTFFPGPTSDSGGFQNGVNAPVSFIHIETVGAIMMPPVGPGPFLIQGTNGDDDIQVTATGFHSFSFSVNAGPTIPVVGAPNLYIDTLAGDDEVNITGPAPSVPPAPYFWDESISVSGTTHAAGSGNIDVLSFNTPIEGALSYTPGAPPVSPSGDDNGTLTYFQQSTNANATTIAIGPFTIPNFVVNPAPPPALLPYVSSTGGMNQLTVNGEGQGDPLTVAGLNTTVVATPGATPDSGKLAVGGFLPISYTNLGAPPIPPITVTSALTFVDNGTAGNDTFTVAGTGANAGLVTLNSQLPIQAKGATNLVLNGLQGDNTYTVNAGSTYANIKVNGSGQSDPDVLDFVGDNLNPVTVNLSNDTIQETGDALISYVGVGQINITAGALQGVAFIGTSGNDQLAITPTGANTATVQEDGAAPLFNIVSASAVGDFRTGPANTLAVDGSSSSHTFTVTNSTVTVTGDLPIDYTPAALASLDINGQDSNNQLIVNSAGAGPLAGPVTTPIVYNGGAGNHNSLTLEGGTVPVTGSDTYTPGPGTGQGTSILNFGTVAVPVLETVHFNNLSPVLDTVAGPLTVVATNANDAITAAADPTIVGNGLVSVNNLETISFLNKTSLTLNGQSGNDTFNVSPFGIQTGSAVMTAINVNGSADASDQVTVNGTTVAGNSIDYSPSATPGSGTVQVATAPTVAPVVITSAAGLSINGQAGSNPLTVTTPAGANTITYNPGATVDSASVQVGSLLPMSFTNLGTGATSSVTLVNIGGAHVDSLVYNGTPGADKFIVDPATGTVHLNSQIPVLTPGVANLTLNGLGGNDSFTVNANPYTNVTLNGSSAQANDVATLNGNATAAILNLGGQVTTVSGGGLSTALVSVRGIGTVNMNAGGVLTVNDTTSPNTLSVTPTSGTTAIEQIVGQSPVVNSSSTGPLTVGFTAVGSADTLQVNGSTSADVFNASGTSVAIVGQQVVNYGGASALDLAGGVGGDTFNVQPAAIPISVDGGDPIGVLPGDTLTLVGAGGGPLGGKITFNPGPTSDSGGFVAGANAPVSFTHIESIGPIVGTGAVGPVLINGTNGDDDIQVTATGTNAFTVSVNGGPVMAFAGEPTLEIDTLAGDDEVNITGPTAAMGLWNETIDVAGATHAAGSGNIDVLSFNTPAGGGVVYKPTGADSGTLNYKGSGADTTVVNIGSNAGLGLSPGGANQLTLNGEAGGGTLTVNGTGFGGDTIRHTPGANNDAGTVSVNSLLPISYTSLGAGPVNITDTGGGAGDPNTLIVNGAGNGDTFNVAGGTGTITLNNHVPIVPTGIQGLVLDGSGPNDTFNLNATLPFLTTTVNADPAVLNLNSVGPTTMAVFLANDTITGFGGVVNYNGFDIVNLNGNPAVTNTLTVTGTPNDDNIVYTPTSPTGGTFNLMGVPTTYNFTIGSAAADVFTVTGGGATGADQVTVDGPNAGSVFTVNEPTRTVTVANSTGTALEPVVLDGTAGNGVQVLNAVGGLGNNTFLVIPAHNPAGSDMVGPGFKFPNNLLVNVNGGGLASEAALVVGGPLGAMLPSTLFAAILRGDSPNSGVIRMFQDSGATEPIQYPDITYTNVAILNANTFDPAGDATGLKKQSLVMGPDTYDPNGSLATAAYLGTGAAINVSNLAIFPNSQEHAFVGGEQDWFRVVAQTTGTMDFQVYFKQELFPTGNDALPGAGELNIDVFDKSGNLITNFGVNDANSDQRRRVPVVAGETYYLKVIGADPSGLGVNGYSISIINTPAPTPDSVGLNVVVANGVVIGAPAPTTTTFAAMNAPTPPSAPPASITQPLLPLSSIPGFYVGKYLVFTTSPPDALHGQRELISSYTLPGGVPTFGFAGAFTVAPTAIDTFQIESNDTGRSQLDNVTRDNTPTIYVRLDAANNAVAQSTISTPTSALTFAANAAASLSAVDNFYTTNYYLEFTGGPLVGQKQQITAYVGATRSFTFTTPFSAAPLLGESFQIIAGNADDGLLDLQGGGSFAQTPPNSTIIPIPFWDGAAVAPPNGAANNGSYRVALYDDSNPTSPIFLGYASEVPLQTGVFQFKVPAGKALTEGVHTIDAKVEIDSPTTPSDIDISPAATFSLVIDTIAPPVFFGTPTTPNSGLAAGSDSAVPGQPALLVDRITNVSAPTFYGEAEANAIIKVYADSAGTGVFNANADPLIGQTTAIPLDGTNQDPNGQWSVTSTIDLNNPKYFAALGVDGVRHVFVTAEDAAGNVSAPQELTFFLDTQGPMIANVFPDGFPGFNLFLNKPATPAPTPVVTTLDVTFVDNPIRVGPDFVYPAVNKILATTIAYYQLVGENTGPVTITSIDFIDSTVSGGVGMTTVKLHFATPLPDDRYNFMISDKIADNPDNALDGEFNGATFPTGNGAPGGPFNGNFTVNSHAHIATYASGSVAIDLNGNGIFDPANTDINDRDTTFTLGFATDTVFSGNFGPNTNPANTVDGFSKLAAYGQGSGGWRWLYDDKLGTNTVSVAQPTGINGMPVAGNWNNVAGGADQVGLFDGNGTWYLDRAGAGFISAADLANPAATLHGDMKGLPIVGNFDGSGLTSLATYQDGVFYFDLAFDDPGHILTGNFNRTLDVGGLNGSANPLANNIGLAVANVETRPVAGNLTAAVDTAGAPIIPPPTDIGLFVPGREENAPSAGTGAAEWYILVYNPATAKPGEVTGLSHAFDPTPLGHDLFFQFGNQAALPLTGLFDPPPAAGSTPITTTPAPTPTPTPAAISGWVANTYADILGRTPSASEIAYWQNAMNNGMTPQQVAQGFINSPERLNTLINNLYTQYLGRTADQQGLQYWTSVWLANGGPEQVQAGIIGSIEYFQTAAAQNPTLAADAAWVTALYNNILGRAPDAGGLASWTSFLQQNGDSSATKQSVVMGFVTSVEYRITLINGWFEHYLGRTLDASGQQYWLGQLEQGVGQDAIQAGIIGSAEFRAKFGS